MTWRVWTPRAARPLGRPFLLLCCGDLWTLLRSLLPPTVPLQASRCWIRTCSPWVKVKKRARNTLQIRFRVKMMHDFDPSAVFRSRPVYPREPGIQPHRPEKTAGIQLCALIGLGSHQNLFFVAFILIGPTAVQLVHFCCRQSKSPCEPAVTPRGGIQPHRVAHNPVSQATAVVCVTTPDLVSIQPCSDWYQVMKSI